MTSPFPTVLFLSPDFVVEKVYKYLIILELKE
jgi:hypothetical protein